jgi:hypothetical protein
VFWQQPSELKNLIFTNFQKLTVNFIFSTVIAQVIVIPFLMGVLKYKKMDGSFRPFIFLLFAGILAELSSFILIALLHRSNAPAIKIYSLAECIIILWLFCRWGLFDSRKSYFYILLIICIIFWLLEEIVFGGILNFIPFFRIFYSFLIVLISINQINYLMLVNVGRNLFRNARFIICIAFIIFFIYQILYEAAYFVADHSTENYSLTNNIISLFGYINLLVNILYIAAVYFIPQGGLRRFGKNINFDQMFK